MKKLILSVALASLSVLAWALPTLQQVEAEVGQGHYTQAESMMREVVAARPESARAHYVYAEILARDGKVPLAIEEARKARQIDPDVKFTDPEKFRTFEAALLRAQNPALRQPATPPPSERGVPAQVAPARVAPASAGLPSWVWLAGLAALGFVLWRMFSRSRNAPLAGGMAAPGAAGYGMPMQGGTTSSPYGVGPQGQPPYGPGYAPQRPGTGALGVGLAAAGGVAAGMLADELLHRRQGGNPERDAGAGGGLFDAPQGGNGGVDLDNRPIDFGTGGADWDSGSSDAGGGFDAGGGGGGGGWDS